MTHDNIDDGIDDGFVKHILSHLTGLCVFIIKTDNPQKVSTDSYIESQYQALVS